MAVTPAVNAEQQQNALHHDLSVLQQIQIIALLKLAEEQSDDFYNLVLDWLTAFYAEENAFLSSNDFRQLREYIINDQEQMFY